MEDIKYNTYFKNYHNAIDDKCLFVYVSIIDYILFQKRKRDLSQNMFGTYTFALKFYYILLDWENSAYNDCIFKDKTYKPNFTIFSKKCFFIDTSYYNTDYVLYLYYDIKYYLKK